MREVLILSFALATLLFASCNEPMPEKAKQVKVGMTYEEVEKVLGKPSAIERGVSQLKSKDAQDVSLEELKNNGFPQAQRKDSAIWFWVLPSIIETTGELLYVTWVYSDISDTTKCTVFTEENIPHNVPSKRMKYYINGRETSQAYYEACRIVESRTSFGYDFKTVIVNDTTSTVVEHDTVRTKYEIIGRFCVIFDASSGRVVMPMYCPNEIVIAQ